MKKLLILSIASFFLVQCNTIDPKFNNELATLLEDNQYFELAKRMQQDKEKLSKSQYLYYQAHCDNAFNEVNNSAKAIENLFENYDDKLTDKQKANLLKVKIRNLIREFEYNEIPKLCKVLLTKYGQLLDSTQTVHFKDVEHHYSVLSSLNVGKPKVHKPNADIEIASERNKHLNLIMVPVKNKEFDTKFLFDTGAEMSVISNTTAKKLGLKVIKTGTNIESSTSQKTEANIAIADSIYIGGILFENVVFAVMPLPNIPSLDFYCHGIIGMPEMEKLGEIHIRKDGSMFLPKQPTKRSEKNIFFSSLDGLFPIVKAENGKKQLKMILDTGAVNSNLSSNYYRRFKTAIEKVGKLEEQESAGVAGSEIQKIYLLPKFSFGLDIPRQMKIRNMPVAVKKIDEFEFDGYLGEDILIAYKEIILNFKDMYLNVSIK